MLLSMHLLLLCGLTLVSCQFPCQCLTKTALDSKTCCPVGADNSPCNSNSGRGSCLTYTPGTTPYNDNTMDRRLRWPSGLWNQVCRCNFPYWGPACDWCHPRRTGPTCSQERTVVRRECRQQNCTERARYLADVVLSKYTLSTWCCKLEKGDYTNTSSFVYSRATVHDCYVAMHNQASRSSPRMAGQSRTDLAHESPCFLTFHRMFLLYYQAEMQSLTCNPNWAICCWNWTMDTNTCGVCNDTMAGKTMPDGSYSPESPFSYWKVACSGSTSSSGCQETGPYCSRANISRRGDSTCAYPTPKDMADALNRPVYDREPFTASALNGFRSSVEGYVSPDGNRAGNFMHVAVHSCIGGNMDWTTIAFNDPIFTHHHCNVDCAFAAWMKIHNKNSTDFPANNISGCHPWDAIFPFVIITAHPEMMVPTENWGYTCGYINDTINNYYKFYPKP
ncbi:tyrosinase-like [Ambystoma mexicanum]|uniref:tyrosinase-like n=1 Tax=Ambystoma mexicanum TaxID=8296 RepID=UPI0037E84CCA